MQLKTVCFVMFLLLSLLLPACNGSDDTHSDTDNVIQDEPDIDYTLSYKTLSPDNSDFEHMAFDLDNNLITLYPESRFYDSIRPGDIYIAGISQQFPKGLFERVTYVGIKGESIELAVEPAYLADAFKYLSLDMKKTISFSDIQPTYLGPGVVLEDGNNKLCFKIDTEIYDHDSDPSTTGDQIRVSGTIDLSISFEQTIDISLWNLNSMEFTPRLTEETQLMFSSAYGHVINKKLVIARLSVIPFAVGPVVFTPEINLMLNSSGKLTASAAAEVTYTHVYVQRFVHDGNALTLRDEENDAINITPVEPVLAAAVDLTAAIIPATDFQLFGVSTFSCFYEDIFNLVGLVRSDTDQVCWDTASKYGVLSQVNFTPFSGQVLEETEQTFNFSTTETPTGEGCALLLQQAPVAIAGNDQEVKENTEVFLYGDASYDLDDDIFSWQWKQTYGPDVELNGASQENTSFTSPEISPQAETGDKTLIFDLEITDFSGNIDSDSVIVTITDVNSLPEQDGTITGTVLDFATRTPIEEITVKLIEKDNQTISGRTDGNGIFSIPAHSTDFTIEISKDGYHTFTVTKLNLGSGQEFDFGEILLSDNAVSGNGEISIALTDAISGTEIEGAALSISKYSNGPTLENGTTENDGSYTFTSMDPGGYFITARASDYHTATIIAASHGGVTAISLPMEPKVASTDEIRLVLSWGPSSSNLDAHIFAPTGSGGRFHLFYPYLHLSNPEKANIVLNRDDTFPSGIETITIENRFPGTYTYMVHDYTHNDSENSTALSESGAVVKVYKGFSEVNRFEVPASQAGNYWEVLTIDGSTGAVTPINKMSHDTISDIISRSGSYDNSYNELAK